MACCLRCIKTDLDQVLGKRDCPAVLVKLNVHLYANIADVEYDFNIL